MQRRGNKELPSRPNGKGPEGEEVGSSGQEPTLSRRKVVKTALAAATVGAAGGALVMAGVSSGTPAALGSGTPEPKGASLRRAIEPSVVFLRDEPTIAVDASLGNDFRLTLHDSRTMASPSHAADGQRIIFQITQGPGGGHTITWGRAYAFAATLPRPALSTAEGHTDLLGFIYNKAKGKWLLAAAVRGFAA